MNATAPTETAPRAAHGLAWPLLALVLVIVGCKLGLIAGYSSPLPFLDQWKGEGAQVLRPWLRGELRAGDLVAPFNEHRILPSRVLVLGLFEANARQWDAQVQMVAGAFLHAGCAAVLGALLVRRLGSHRRWPVLGALLVLFGLPFDWQNTLWGFQSQFYFLILFTVLAIWGLAGHAAGSARWWGGVGAGLLACLSMGSGGFAGLALAGWLGTKVLLLPAARQQRGAGWTLAVAAGLGGFGFALYTPPQAASLQALHVQSPGAFLQHLGIHLSWPHAVSPWLAVLAFAPVVVLGGMQWRSARRDPTRGAADSLNDFLLPLALWVALQAAALAYCRNAPTSAVISRYMDLFALGVLVNFCALLRLADLAARAPGRRMAQGALLGWTALMLAGFIPLLQRNVRLDLPSLQKIHHLQVAAVRQFLITGHAADLGGKPVFGLPPADLDLLAGLLRDPAIQNALPTGLGIRRMAAPAGPLSVASRLLIDGWGMFVGAGLAVFGFATIPGWLLRRRAGPAPQGTSDPCPDAA